MPVSNRLDETQMAFISMQRSNSNAFVLNFEPRSVFYKKLMAKLNNNPQLLKPFVVFNSMYINPRLSRPRPKKPNLILTSALRNLKQRGELSLIEDKPSVITLRRSKRPLRKITPLPLIFDLKDVDSKLRVLDVTLDKTLEAVRDLNVIKLPPLRRLRLSKTMKKRNTFLKRHEQSIPRTKQPTDNKSMAFSSHSISSSESKSTSQQMNSSTRPQSSGDLSTSNISATNEAESSKKEEELVDLLNKLEVNENNSTNLNETDSSPSKLHETTSSESVLEECVDSRTTFIPITKYEDMSSTERQALRPSRNEIGVHMSQRSSRGSRFFNLRHRKTKFPPVCQLFDAKQTLSIERTRRMLEGQIKSSLSGVNFSDTSDYNLTDTLCKMILQQICSEATALQDLKIIVNLVIFENLKQGANVSTQCLWNPETDVFASTKVYLKNMIIVACVQIVKKLPENNV